MNFFEHLYYFFNVSRAKNFSSATQLVYFHILFKWNCLRQPKKFALSDAELTSITGLTKKIITDEKRRLKNLGFIDFATKFGAVTRYCILDREQVISQKSSNNTADLNPDAVVCDTTNTNNKNLKSNCAREGVKLNVHINF